MSSATIASGALPAGRLLVAGRLPGAFDEPHVHPTYCAEWRSDAGSSSLRGTRAGAVVRGPVVVREHADHALHRPGTSISRLQRSGTWSNPSARAATAGNSASRSSVQCEDAADEALGLEPVPTHQLAHRARGRAEDRFGVVALGLGRAPRLPRGAQFVAHRAAHPSRAARPRARRAFAPRPPAAGRARASRTRPRQRDDLVADRLRHPPDLAVAPLADRDLDPALSARARPAPARRPVLELDAPRRSRSRSRPRSAAAQPHPVGPLDAVARMGEPVRELAVVRQQDQPGRVGVEAADRIEPPLGRRPAR